MVLFVVGLIAEAMVMVVARALIRVMAVAASSIIIFVVMKLGFFSNWIQMENDHQRNQT